MVASVRKHKLNRTGVMCRLFFCQMQLHICSALSTSRRDSFIIRPLIKNDFGNEVLPAANENYVGDLCAL